MGSRCKTLRAFGTCEACVGDSFSDAVNFVWGGVKAARLALKAGSSAFDSRSRLFDRGDFDVSPSSGIRGTRSAYQTWSCSSDG